MILNDIQLRLQDVKGNVINVLTKSRELQKYISQFNLPPKSTEELISEAKKDLNLLFLTLEQKVIVNEICTEIAGFIPFNDYVIRGFINRGIREWQIIHNQPIAILSQMTRNEQFKAGNEILNYIKLPISRAMRISDKKLKMQFINEVMRLTSEYYDELLSIQAFSKNPLNQKHFIEVELEKTVQLNSFSDTKNKIHSISSV